MLRKPLFLIGSIVCLLMTTMGISGARNTSAKPVSQNPGMFLTGPQAGSAKEIAWAYVRNNKATWQLTDTDLADVITTDQYTDDYNGVTHVYFRQRFNGIEVYQANININIARDGSVINIGNDFVANGSAKLNAKTPTLLPEQAAMSAAQHLRLNPTKSFDVQQRSETTDRVTLLGDGGIARKPIPAKLMYQQTASGLQLVWNLEIDEVGAQNYWSIRVDALNGAFVDQTNYVIHEDFHAQAAEAGHDLGHSDVVEQAAKPAATNLVGGGAYRVYAFPVESPIHGARTLVSDPANSVASPYGWHDTNGAAGAEYTVTRGNNVSAIEDGSNIGFQPNGGAGLSFDYPIDLTQGPNAYESGAITNLFYISNMMHDVMYRKGFTEASGNFQANNYGRGGSANDAVVAEAQDGGGTNNANFSTPPDGGAGRMQMYLWTNTTPQRDGDLDNGIIAHEYGHGISIRLTGGPANSSCLNNQEQGGEGWSDFFGINMTIEPGDTGADKRGVGTYALGQPVTGNGIRAYPYSTNMTTDPRTYDAIKTAAVPHGVGSVWAAMLWEMNWGLINQYGFDPNLYSGTGGNNIALQLVIDGLKLQPCSPGFVDARNAILQADQTNNAGANQCIIWTAFAKRGLGYSATQGLSSSRTDGVQAFNLPASCVGGPTSTPLPTATRTPGPTATSTPVVPPTATNTPVTPPTATSIPLPTATPIVGGNGILNPGFESGTSPWVQTSSGGYTIPSTTRPRTGSYSAYFGGYNSATETLYQTVTVPSNGSLKYWWYNTTNETSATAYDYLRVRIYSTSGTLLTTLRSWSNASAKNVWSQDTLSLAAYAGQTVRVQFTVTTDSSLTTSFFVDDVSLTGTSAVAPASSRVVDEVQVNAQPLKVKP